MSYVKINWLSGTLLTARRFAHMDTQYDEAKAFADDKYDVLLPIVRYIVREDTTLELRTHVSATLSGGTSAEALLHTDGNEFKGYDGSLWWTWGEKYDL